MKQNVLNSILDKKIVAILRGLEFEQNLKVMDNLIEVGITNFEVTLNTPGALNIIEEARKKYDNTAYVGAGTVLTKTDALKAIQHGAQFLITPNTNEESIEVAIQNDILIAPGVFSPTEIAKALDCGCEIVKLFPAATLGSDYISQLKGPFNNLKIMAVGGIDIENMGTFLKAGAHCFGLGSALVNTKLVQEGDYIQLKENFKKYTSIVL